MRTVSATIASAVNTGTSYRMKARARIYPSQTFFSALTSNFPVPGADAAGMSDSPLPQDVGYSSQGYAVSFLRVDGTLQYAVQGNENLVNTGIAITGKPGVSGSTIYYIAGGLVYRATIDWASVHARSGSPFGSAANLGAPFGAGELHVHGVSATKCAVVIDDDGGLRVGVYDGSWHTQPGRFMFPKFIDYTGGGAERTMSSLGLFSGALELGDRIFVYLSNNAKGSVEAIAYDSLAGAFEDRFTAVATDLVNGFCEFRVSNAYTRNGTAFLCGQFRRTENASATDRVYSMLLYSLDGRGFAQDRFSLVSDLGYRFLAAVGNAGFFLDSCNRVCSGPITYLTDGASGTAGAVVEVPDVLRFSDNSLQSAALVVPAGNESLMFNASVVVGSKVVVEVSYATSAGEEWVTYGTYIIDSVSKSVEDGGRALELQLVNESSWKMAGLSSPYYVEIPGKSSTYEVPTEDGSAFYVAHNLKLIEGQVSVDFWGCEPYTNEGQGVTGVNILSEGGVNYYEAADAHKVGIITPELKSKLGVTANPRVQAAQVDFRVYGWSEAGGDISAGDAVTLVAITEDATGHETTAFSSYTRTWAGDDLPLQFLVALPVGDRIQKIGLVFEKAVTSSFCPARIYISGIEVESPFKDYNTPWTSYVSDGYPGMKLPGRGRPYIMFSQKPYGAENFQVAALFNSTFTSVADMGIVGPGLVALADDGANLLILRYNQVFPRLELVKVRDGYETIIYNTPPTVAVGQVIGLMFEHKDGVPRASMPDINGVWTEQFAYEWGAADGWMYTSETTEPKCGIYGIARPPYFKITGYNPGKNETIVNADGIAVLPGSTTSFNYGPGGTNAWPASGTIQIEENRYTYTTKVEPPAVSRGPYQLRQAGSSSIDCRDYHPGAAADLLAGKLLSVDDGGVYIITTSNWAPSSGTHRAKHSSANDQAGAVFRTLASRVYVSGGLTGITRTQGERTTHAHGSVCQLYVPGDIFLLKYFGSSGELDSTVADLIKGIAASAGASVRFPGDTVVASQAVLGDTLIWTQDYSDGFDVRFRVGGGTTVAVKTDINLSEVAGFGADTHLEIQIVPAGASSTAKLISRPSGTLVEGLTFSMGAGQHRYRVLLHENLVSIYVDGRWVGTFGKQKFTYPAQAHVWLTGTFTALDLLISELSDWREATFIDLDTDAQSAVGQILQERPVESMAEPDGALSMWYGRVRQTVTQVQEPRKHRWSSQIPKDCGSDAIVYGAKEVKSIQFQPFAIRYGFSTKVVRMPNLWNGALRAAYILLKRLLNRSVQHELVIRPDVRLAPGDKLVYSYIASGTGRAMSGTLLVQDVRLEVDERNPAMNVTGFEEIAA